jgi:hypothetical protein
VFGATKQEKVTPTIFIGSYKGSPFLQGCLDSIPTNCECIVVRNDGYECGCLRWVQANYQGDKFLFIQDSSRIKNPVWVYDCFLDSKSYSLNNETGLMSMYSGVYRTDLLRQITIPETKTKMDAVLFEMSIGHAYGHLDPQTEVLWPELTFENARNERIFEREVKVYENDFFLKYKTCHGGHLIEECCLRDQQRRAQIV